MTKKKPFKIYKVKVYRNNGENRKISINVGFHASVNYE